MPEKNLNWLWSALIGAFAAIIVGGGAGIFYLGGLNHRLAEIDNLRKETKTNLERLHSAESRYTQISICLENLKKQINDSFTSFLRTSDTRREKFGDFEIELVRCWNDDLQLVCLLSVLNTNDFSRYIEFGKKTRIFDDRGREILLDKISCGGSEIIGTKRAEIRAKDSLLVTLYFSVEPPPHALLTAIELDLDTLERDRNIQFRDVRISK